MWFNNRRKGEIGIKQAEALGIQIRIQTNTLGAQHSVRAKKCLAEWTDFEKSTCTRKDSQKQNPELHDSSQPAEGIRDLGSAAVCHPACLRFSPGLV